MILFALLAVPAAAAVRVSVHVEGVSDEVKANVLASLSIAQYKNFGSSPNATIRRLNAQAAAQIRDALEPFGYFSPRIDSKLSRDGEIWTATYRIEPGRPVEVRRVVVKVKGAGADDPVFQALERQPPIRPGQPLRQALYTQTRQALQETAAERGYLDGHFTEHTLRVDPEKYTADVVLVYRTGPRYRFGKVTIHQDILDPDFVHRFVQIKPGDPYSTRRLADLQSALSSSDYFASVAVTPRKDEAQDLRVPVDVETTPAKRNRYVVGAGYGTDTGPRFRFGWENRRVNREGHRIRFDARISRIETQATAQYIVPLGNPASERLVFSATDNQENYGDTVGRLLGVGVSRITQIGAWQRDQYIQAGRYTSEIGADTQVGYLVTPGITFSRISIGLPARSRFGYSVTADFRGAAKALASDVSFARADVSARLSLPFGPGEFLLRGELGAVGAGNFDRLPVAERFFAGGDNSVRGYAYQSIGPRNAQGLVVGGRYLKVGSIEYDWRIVGNWGIAGFYDAGTASDSFTASLDRGVGVGVRYYTPVGAIRVDFAHPISQPGLGFYRIHISIGLSL